MKKYDLIVVGGGLSGVRGFDTLHAEGILHGVVDFLFAPGAAHALDIQGDFQHITLPFRFLDRFLFPVRTDYCPGSR